MTGPTQADRLTPDVWLHVAAITEPMDKLPTPSERKAIRIRANVTLKELAAVLGTHELTMDRVEAGFARFYSLKDLAYRRVLAALSTSKHSITMVQLGKAMLSERVFDLTLPPPNQRELIRKRVGVSSHQVARLCQVGLTTARRYETNPNQRKPWGVKFMRYKRLLQALERFGVDGFRLGT